MGREGGRRGAGSGRRPAVETEPPGRAVTQCSPVTAVQHATVETVESPGDKD